jgi:hypothetical protein
MRCMRMVAGLKVLGLISSSAAGGSHVSSNAWMPYLKRQRLSSNLLVHRYRPRAYFKVPETSRTAARRVFHRDAPDRRRADHRVEADRLTHLVLAKEVTRLSGSVLADSRNTS